mmetsp:Transcript_11185/g.38878  ORF Transcript_11185/g.38878 Transcript_11185/m.38878 type:complete len:225 (-) Transcript_11185:854-1528(-)
MERTQSTRWLTQVLSVGLDFSVRFKQKYSGHALDNRNYKTFRAAVRIPKRVGISLTEPLSAKHVKSISQMIKRCGTEGVESVHFYTPGERTPMLSRQLIQKVVSDCEAPYAQVGILLIVDILNDTIVFYFVTASTPKCVFGKPPSSLQIPCSRNVDGYTTQCYEDIQPPELLCILGDDRVLSGWSPALLHTCEILGLGTAESAKQESFAAMLRNFCHIKQRFGK